VRYSILSEATFVYCEKMDKKEFSVLMKHYTFWRKKIMLKPRQWLDKHYLDSAPVKSTVEKWFAKFQRGEMSIEDAVTPERGCYRRKQKKSPQNNFE
jgi:hypothetical protein